MVYYVIWNDKTNFKIFFIYSQIRYFCDNVYVLSNQMFEIALYILCYISILQHIIDYA